MSPSADGRAPAAAPAPDLAGYFDAMYRDAEDPYGLRGRWYEARKRALLLASLPRPRFRSALEPGCGIGELTAGLAVRCDAVLALDFDARAVERARARCADWPQVRLRQARLPEDWPAAEGPFDLIVLSEVAYFLDAAAFERMLAACDASLADDGCLAACDWRPDFDRRQLPTSHIHARLGQLGLSRLLRHEEDDFLLQVFCRDPRSVARQEGIR